MAEPHSLSFRVFTEKLLGIQNSKLLGIFQYKCILKTNLQCKFSIFSVDYQLKRLEDNLVIIRDNS